MSNILEVNDYFNDRMSKIIAARKISGIEMREPFLDYLKRRYKDSCYYYSAFAIMGLEKSDKLVRGLIDLNKTNHATYNHGWVVFEYENEFYVFDSLLHKIITLEEYTSKYHPNILCSLTQSYLIEEFTSPDLSKKISFNKYKVNDFSLEYGECNIDMKHIYLPYSNAEISIKNKDKVRKFVGYH